ncbi:fluoride efflux transporter FluC [Longivirga aurantiaca]|uniref:Fluoride-specific ion channel FluC n=1 Tax=Longivirga aurantiaca TaxID=1837743 RepID=A0ABW1SXC3_9ACTN
MTPLALLLVALGSAVGAPVRFLVERRLAGAYPWGTFVVNVAGSALLGVVVAAAGTSGSTPVVALVGIGFCGALTTFGGYAAQVLDLAVAPGSVPGGQRLVRSLVYAALSVAGCVAVAAISYVTVVSLTSG